MNDGKLLTISDFEWASVSRYLVYVSSVAGLVDVSSEHVHNFGLAKWGRSRLLAQKQRVLVIMTSNQKKLENFVGSRRDELREEEISVIRSIYVQTKRNIDTVKEHILIAESYRAAGMGDLLQEKGDQDDALF